MCVFLVESSLTVCRPAAVSLWWKHVCFFPFMVTSSERKNKHKKKEWMNELNIVYNMGQKPTVRQCKRLANIFTNA